MANPIQQLVDAANNAATVLAERGAGSKAKYLREKVAAVESAEVETRWEVRYLSNLDEWILWLGFKEEAAALQELKNRRIAFRDMRLVRIDTYRSVESDQK